MRKETFLKKVVAGIGSAALAITLIGCAHHTATTADGGYGQIRTEAPAAASSGTTVGTTAAPSNTVGVTASTTPAVISGPAVVDNTGRAYTSSSAGGTGNDSTVGNNTNVNLIPKKTKSEVIVTQSAATVETTPAPVIETPAPVVVETPAPMASSATEQTPTTTTDTTATTKTTGKHHHRRMHKD